MSLHVLVADDDQALAGFVTTFLRSEGYAVTHAANGREALACLERAVPDVILTDLMMPVMTGWELLAAVRAAGLRVPVVFMSAGTNAQAEAVAYGADGYLAKPFDGDRLLRALKRFILSVPAEHGGQGRPDSSMDERTPRPQVAVLNSNDDLIVLLQRIVEEAGFTSVSVHVSEIGRTAEAILAFLDRHQPRVVLYDISPPYPDNWALLRQVQATDAAAPRQYVVTTPNKDALEELVGPTEAIELIGTAIDRAAIVEAIRRAVAV